MGGLTRLSQALSSLFFFFNDTATTEIYTLSLHDALPSSAVALKLLALFLGLAVGVMIPLGLWLAASAHDARNDAKAAAKAAPGAAATAMPGMPGMSSVTSKEGAYATPSFAGIAPANADALAMAHKSYPAELPAAPPG